MPSVSKCCARQLPPPVWRSASCRGKAYTLRLEFATYCKLGLKGHVSGVAAEQWPGERSSGGEPVSYTLAPSDVFRVSWPHPLCLARGAWTSTHFRTHAA